MEAQLLAADGKVIYTDTQDLHDFLNNDQVDQLRLRPLAIEGRLVAVPGKYQLRVDVTNRVTKQSFAQTRGVLVPAFDHSSGNEPGRLRCHGVAATRFSAESAV